MLHFLPVHHYYSIVHSAIICSRVGSNNKLHAHRETLVILDVEALRSPSSSKHLSAPLPPPIYTRHILSLSFLKKRNDCSVFIKLHNEMTADLQSRIRSKLDKNYISRSGNGGEGGEGGGGSRSDHHI